MRIHTLTLRGIGPFRDQQTVDFDDVGRHGLFLLDGPTGVGKSTIVDAIVYALFGKPATEDGQDRMVSDFLGDDIRKAHRPFVELTFTTADGTFRIRREPKSPYRNRQGSVSEHNATVRLSRVTNEAADADTLVSSSAQDVGNEVVRLLGLNREQVLSTIVLAQGQFARFLKAKTEDRREILQSVFNTQRYERLQWALQDARKVATGQREAAGRSLGEAMAAFFEAAGLPGDPAGLASAFQSDASVAEEVQRRVAELQHMAESAASQAEQAQITARGAATALVAGEQVAANAERKRALLQRQQALLEQQSAVRGRARELEVARAALVLAPLDAAMSAVRDEWQAAVAALTDAIGGLPVEQQSWGAEALETAAVSLVATRAALGEAVELEKGLPGMAADRQRIALEISELDESIGQVTHALAAMPDREQAARQECDTLRELAASLPSAERDLQVAQDAAVLLAQVDSYRDAVVGAKRQAIETAEVAQVAEDALAAARRRYRSGIAAELAGDLAAGESCPVCGATEHPAPAQVTQDHVSAEEVDRLTAEWRTLDGIAQGAASDLAAKQAALDAAAVRLTWSDPEEVNLAFKRAAERVEWAQEAAAELPVAVARLADLTAQRDRLTGELLAQRERVAARRQDLAGIERRRSDADERITRERAEFHSVRSRHDHLTETIAQLRAAGTARRREETARHSFDDAAAAFESALGASPFTDVEAVRAAVRSEAWISAAEHEVAEHAQDVHAVGEQLDGLRDVDATVVVDLAGLTAASEQARQAADAAVGRSAAARQRFDRAGVTRDAVVAARDTWADTQRTTAPIMRLASIANGQAGNLHAVKLATYVVKRRFGDVVDAANTHLADMSGGRYRLEVSDGPGGRERTLGLNLNIYDDRTDAPRGPATLSGGETFYVSLALALGLADVVQSESGGIALETLFVDEGFGSLDSETLDTVMNVLGRLSRGHRTVGLISHVEEMKSRIPDRIQLHRPDPNGPSEITAKSGSI